MLQVKLEFHKSDFILQEEIYFTLSIKNNGSDMIEIIDPNESVNQQLVFFISGPGYEEGFHFDNSTFIGNENNLVSKEFLNIKPGESWESEFSLNSFLNISSVGEYQLASELDFQGIINKSEEQTFSIWPSVIESIHLGSGSRPLQNGEGDGSAIISVNNVKNLYSFSFKENRPDLGETDVRVPIHRLILSTNATDVNVPWKNSPFYSELLQWIVWREGKSIKAISNTSEFPVSYEFPDLPDILIKPALKIPNGPVEVLVLSKSRTELSLIQFADNVDKENSLPQLIWSTSLPSSPYIITAALAPQAQNNSRHIAYVVKKDKGFEVYHSTYAEMSPPAIFKRISIQKGQLIDNSNLSLFVDNKGIAYISILAISNLENYGCLRVEIQIENDGSIQKIITSLGKMIARPTGGATLYVDKEGDIIRREAVIIIEDSSIVRLNPSGEIVPVLVPGVPTSPILLIPGKKLSYILYHDPVRGLYFEPL
ncbi:MAG: hypothetical protein OQK56_00300 [Ignavibacteriaceae bacterium]|nr:hypothetical protein [Ignavibacteriaceae bacterium]